MAEGSLLCFIWHARNVKSSGIGWFVVFFFALLDKTQTTSVIAATTVGLLRTIRENSR